MKNCKVLNIGNIKFVFDDILNSDCKKIIFEQLNVLADYIIEYRIKK